MVNFSAHLIYKAPKSAHITLLHFDLQWLLISSGIQYKVVLTCLHIVSGTALSYLSELLYFCSLSHSLCSASDTQIFHFPRVCSRTWGEILSVYRICHLELSSFLSQTCHITLLFQVKTENSPLLFCLLIYHFLSSVSINPMTSMLMFLRCACVSVCVCMCMHVVYAVACKLCAHVCVLSLIHI